MAKREKEKEKNVKRNEMKTMELQKGDIKNKGPEDNWDQEKKSKWKNKVEWFFGEIGIKRE